MSIVCIVGQKRSGKDTSADFFVEHGAIKLALADPIKIILAEAWQSQKMEDVSGISLTLDDFYDDGTGHGFDREKPILISNKQALSFFTSAVREGNRMFNLPAHKAEFGQMILDNEEPWSIRRFMQVFGTDIVVNKIDPSFWIKLAFLRSIDFINQDKVKRIVISDIRQVAEINTFRFLGAKIVHVLRDQGELNKRKDDHITEAGLPQAPGDIIIHNNGTLPELFVKLSEQVGIK